MFVVLYKQLSCDLGITIDTGHTANTDCSNTIKKILRCNL